MSRILKVSQGDYVVRVQDNGNIVLNTGDSVGTVIITGNLDVKGTTTTVESTTTTVQDNILQLNYGQTGDGISSVLGYQSGIEIGRGDRDKAQFVFSEQVSHYDATIEGEVSGSFRLLTADNVTNSVALSGLQLRTITNDGNADLVFDMQDGTCLLRIENSSMVAGQPSDYNNGTNSSYTVNVLASTDQDVIPNKGYVSAYVSATGGMAQVDQIHYPVTGSIFDALVKATATTIDFKINDNLKAQITNAGVYVDNILIAGDTISDVGLNNLVLTATTNNVEVNAVLNINNQGSAPSAVSGKTKVWTTATEGPGRTGIYFANNTPNTDELVSKNRAVLLSILL